jgi:exo-1,4-beta-D-glucosaminidase
MRSLHSASVRWLLASILNVVISTRAAPFIPIDSWSVISSASISGNVTSLSLPSIETSTWYTLKDTNGTLMATLIANGVYTEDDLFYSTNLQNVDANQFRVPWYYRAENMFGESLNGTDYYTLRTNGISSRADVYLNGRLVADKDTQAGAYVGLEFDVTDMLHANEKNVLLIKVYPTDYNRDFALGFVDWNPYPPDNGTGIWRDVEYKRSGQIALSTPRVTTTLDGAVSVHFDLKNVDKNKAASGTVSCYIHDPQGKRVGTAENDTVLPPGAHAKLSLTAKTPNPQIWWPKQWGSQPLYSVTCTAHIKNTTSPSDTASAKFGIRTVSSTLNTTVNDTTFYINNQPFQVLGAGYTSDIFLRFSETKLKSQFQYVLDMGLNTIRLEGKQEHTRLYEMADEMGLMILSGWECCDKWEGWAYNDEGLGEKWSEADYSIANLSMRHEAEMMQHHPSMLGWLVGSDYWPDDRATKIYVDALKAFDWDVPILASASQRGAPDALGNGGMKMDGPYDWVPPNYWFDPAQRLGSAGGFGSELGAGVGTPELSSLAKFLSPEDLDDLWKKPDKGLYHMSTNVSSFYTRQIYNDALYSRYGKPTCLEDYIWKSQMMDYEATKAQFEAYISRWNKEVERPATGAIYWMLNNAWPSLHWNLFDYYLRPAGSYFGLKSAAGKERHVVFDQGNRDVYLIDRRLAPSASEEEEEEEEEAVQMDIDMIDLNGTSLHHSTIEAQMDFNKAIKISAVPNLNTTQVSLLRLVLRSSNATLSRNTYLLPPTLDVLDWENSTWYHTPVTRYADLTSLSTMPPANLHITFDGKVVWLENKGKVPAVFVRLNLVDGEGEDVVPVMWTENYVMVWPGEGMGVGVEYERAVGDERVTVEVDGRNVARRIVEVGGR